MTRIMKPWIFWSLGVWIFWIGLGLATESLIGQAAPELSGKRAGGAGLLNLGSLMKEISFLKDAQGKFVEKDGQYVMEIKKNVVVLNFFATYCVPCIKEIPSYHRLARKFEGKAVRWLYVNVDTDIDEAKAQRFILEKKIEVPLMLPNQQQVVKDYGVSSLPRMIVIDREGVIVQVITGFQEDLEKQLSDIIQPLLATQ